ncbi:MAG: right-handed parallel beta-helix repeat-containing protein [Solirubrobacterales bacterium]
MKGTPIGTDRRRSAAIGAPLAALAALTITATSAGHAEAAKIHVTNTSGKGKGSFAAAIERANREPDYDTIVFSRQLRGKIRVRRDVEIERAIAIEGRNYGSNGRLRLVGPKHGVDIEFKRSAKKRPAVEDMYLERVAIASDYADLDVRDSYLTGEGTVDEIGVYAGYGYDDAKLRMSGTTVSGFSSGVALYRTDGSIDESVISDNEGSSGIFVGGYSGLRLSESTVSGNVAEPRETLAASGGGIYSVYESDVAVSNSTISGNSAVGSGSSGGGISGEVTVNESTIAANTAETGGGIFASPYYRAQVLNSIVAGNESTDAAAGDDCAGRVNSKGGNLIEDPGTCLPLGTDLTGVDPLLGRLRDNGGPTPTRAIGRGSPAVGLAIDRTATKRDQRGIKRGRDPDAGAFER